MSIIATVKDAVAANPFTAGVVGGIAATLTTVGAIKLTSKFIASRQRSKTEAAVAAAEVAAAGGTETIKAATAS